MRSLRHLFLRTLFFACIIASIFYFSPYAYAGTLSVTPSTISVRAGDIFTVSVRVNSESEAINAVSAKVLFPKQLLQATAISKVGSILSFWVQNPSISNTLGTVSFEGVAMTPGYTGASGKVVSVSFRALKAGTADLTLTQASVLANDGEGTNVLRALMKGIVTIAQGVKNNLSIVSSTHPDSTQWYNTADVRLVLAVPEGAEAMRYSFDKEKDIFSKDEIPPQTTIDQALEDGIWYFHAQAKVSDVWGNLLNVPIQVDTTPPVLLLITPDDSGMITPSATDATSGVVKLTVQNGADEKEIPNNTAGVYETSSIFVAYDAAGNTSAVRLVGDTTLTITDIPKKAVASAHFLVKGTTGGADKVTVYAKKLKPASVFAPVITYTALSTDTFDETFYAVVADGSFTAGVSDLSSGTYAFFAKDPDGKVSNIVLVAISGGFWSKGWMLALSWWYLPLLLLLLLLILLIRRRKAKNLKEGGQNRPVYRKDPIIVGKNADRYTTLLQKIELGVPLNLEERLFIQKLKQYLHTGEDSHQ